MTEDPEGRRLARRPHLECLLPSGGPNHLNPPLPVHSRRTRKLTLMTSGLRMPRCRSSTGQSLTFMAILLDPTDSAAQKLRMTGHLPRMVIDEMGRRPTNVCQLIRVAASSSPKIVAIVALPRHQASHIQSLPRGHLVLHSPSCRVPSLNMNSIHAEMPVPLPIPFHTRGLALTLFVELDNLLHSDSYRRSIKARAPNKTFCVLPASLAVPALHQTTDLIWKDDSLPNHKAQPRQECMLHDTQWMFKTEKYHLFPLDTGLLALFMVLPHAQRSVVHH